MYITPLLADSWLEWDDWWNGNLGEFGAMQMYEYFVNMRFKHFNKNAGNIINQNRYSVH